MPIVEYFQRAPAPQKAGYAEVQEVSAPEKAGKFPQWASLTAVVTGITIFAFATSSFYVFGVELHIHKPLAIFFRPATI